MPDNFGASQLALLMGLIQQKLAAAQLGQPTGPRDPLLAPGGGYQGGAANAPRMGGGNEPVMDPDPTGRWLKSQQSQTGDPVQAPPPPIMPPGRDQYALGTLVRGIQGDTISDAPPMSFEQAVQSTLGPQPPAPLGDERTIQNYLDASDDLALTPQEQKLYQRHLDNLYSQGKVNHPDGSISTLLQAVVTGPDSKYYNIPTVWNGQTVDVATARQLAEQAGWANFPSYSTPDEADARYDRMHGYMEKDMQVYHALAQEQ